MSMQVSGQNVPLPAGWSVSYGNEGTAIVNGQNQRGVTFNLTQVATGAVLTDFIPYTVMQHPELVASQFASKINNYLAAVALGSGGVS